MQLTEHHPSQEWIEWAEAESVRRLKLYLAELRAGKSADQTQDLERTLASWTDVIEELELETPTRTTQTRVVRIHSENLVRA